MPVTTSAHLSDVNVPCIRRPPPRVPDRLCGLVERGARNSRAARLPLCGNLRRVELTRLFDRAGRPELSDSLARLGGEADHEARTVLEVRIEVDVMLDRALWVREFGSRLLEEPAMLPKSDEWAMTSHLRPSCRGHEASRCCWTPSMSMTASELDTKISISIMFASRAGTTYCTLLQCCG